MALAMPIPGAGPAASPGRAAPAPVPARKGAAPAAPPAASSKGAAPQAAAPHSAAPHAAAGAADPFQQVRDAVARFIRQPGELEFTLRPPQPVSFEAMQGLAGAGPVEAARRLGLSATAR